MRLNNRIDWKIWQTQKICGYGWLGQVPSPSPGSQAHTGWDTCPALLHSSTRKNIRHWRTPDVMKVCQFQFRSCSIVNVRCCHESVIFIRSCKYSSFKKKFRLITLFDINAHNFLEKVCAIFFRKSFNRRCQIHRLQRQQLRWQLLEPRPWSPGCRASSRCTSCKKRQQAMISLQGMADRGLPMN